MEEQSQVVAGVGVALALGPFSCDLDAVVSERVASSFPELPQPTVLQV